MSKHTPGPWERLTFSNHEIQTDFAMVKIGGRVHMVGYSQEDCANALLIASAPDLLEALEAFERISALWLPAEVEEQHAEEMYALHMARNQMLAAIAKSRGEA